MGVFTGDGFGGMPPHSASAAPPEYSAAALRRKPTRCCLGYALTVAGADVAPVVEQIARLPTRINPRSETGIIKVVAMGTGQAC